MKYSQVSLSLGLYVLARASPVLAASGSGQTTRYWDCCKTSCAWSGKASVSEPVLTCDKNDNPISDPDAKSGCDGGGAFACTNNSPWAVNDDLAYGFAATSLSGGTESSWCCACYALTFTSGPVAGKKMVVQSTNTGGDLGSNHFDLMIPGGGLGIFDGCTPEFGQSLPGARYGGVSSRAECDQMPELLKDGCYWRFDWFNNADNPTIEFEQVQCPQAILDVSDCKRSDDGNFPVFSGAGSSPASPSSSSASAVAPVQTGDNSSPSDPEEQEPSPTSPSSSSTSTAAPVQTSDNSSPSDPEEQEPSPTSTRDSCPAPTGSPVPVYGQCDAEASWDVPKPCAAGSKCVYMNDWYSQCLPDGSA